MHQIRLILTFFFITIGGFIFSAKAEVLKDHIYYASKKVDYAYYIPPNVPRQADAMILTPGLNTTGEKLITPDWIALADRKGWPIIAPSFVFEGDRAFQEERSYQYPRAWSGYALDKIIQNFIHKGVKIKSLYMAGFSAGAQFSGRYALWQPKKVKKCAIYASGGNDKVKEYVPVEFLYGIGSSDQENRRTFADQFVQQAQTKKIKITKKVYENIAHTFTVNMQRDIIQFFEQD